MAFIKYQNFYKFSGYFGRKGSKQSGNSETNSVAKGPKFRPQNSKADLQKFVRSEKLAAEFSLNLPKKGPNYFEDDYLYKKVKIYAEKYISSPDIFDFSFPLPRELVCKRQIILVFMRRFCMEPNFFASGRIFWWSGVGNTDCYFAVSLYNG
jgi:hypothetical protein